jgi:mevalonate pyrophosphate decarboxylase
LVAVCLTTRRPSSRCQCRYRHRQGTIYIAEKDTPETLARRRNQTDREELMGYWGYKFEDYATRPRAGASSSSSSLAAAVSVAPLFVL